MNILVSVPLLLLCLAPDHRRHTETRFRGMSRELQPEEHPPASGLDKDGPFQQKLQCEEAHPEKNKTKHPHITYKIKIMQVM